MQQEADDHIEEVPVEAIHESGQGGSNWGEEVHTVRLVDSEDSPRHAPSNSCRQNWKRQSGEEAVGQGKERCTT